MRWESPGYVWSVRAYERRPGMLYGEIHHHRMLSWSGWLTALHAYDELNAALKELGAPPLEQMVER